MTTDDIRKFVEELIQAAQSGEVENARAGAQDLTRHDAPAGVIAAAAALDAILAEFDAAIEAAITANQRLVEVGYPALPTLTVPAEVKIAIEGELKEQVTANTLFVTPAATMFGNVQVHAPQPEG